jgi:hypothetical protein
MYRNYEMLLEAHLNAERPPDAPEIEILNFAVGGYRIAQLVDAALEWVPPFEPDVYVLPLSELSVFRRWADHIITLVQNGVDLKYDHIEEVVRQSGLRADDPTGTANAKLARFRLSTIEWAVRSVRAQAESQGARLVVILLPNGTEPEILEEQFAGVRQLLAPLGVPVIDLLDAFETVDDLDAYRTSERNMHPNERGHEFLYERLREAISGDRELTELFTGRASSRTAAAAAPATELDATRSAVP